MVGWIDGCGKAKLRREAISQSNNERFRPAFKQVGSCGAEGAAVVLTLSAGALPLQVWRGDGHPMWHSSSRGIAFEFHRCDDVRLIDGELR